MTDYTRTLPLGPATVSVINLGDLRLSLAETLNVPESEWRLGRLERTASGVRWVTV